jgi:hypothetical protein
MCAVRGARRPLCRLWYSVAPAARVPRAGVVPRVVQFGVVCGGAFFDARIEMKLQVSRVVTVFLCGSSAEIAELGLSREQGHEFRHIEIEHLFPRGIPFGAVGRDGTEYLIPFARIFVLHEKLYRLVPFPWSVDCAAHGILQNHLAVRGVGGGEGEAKGLVVVFVSRGARVEYQGRGSAHGEDWRLVAQRVGPHPGGAFYLGHFGVYHLQLYAVAARILFVFVGVDSFYVISSCVRGSETGVVAPRPQRVGKGALVCRHGLSVGTYEREIGRLSRKEGVGVRFQRPRVGVRQVDLVVGGAVYEREGDEQEQERRQCGRRLASCMECLCKKDDKTARERILGQPYLIKMSEKCHSVYAALFSRFSQRDAKIGAEIGLHQVDFLFHDGRVAVVGVRSAGVGACIDRLVEGSLGGRGVVEDEGDEIAEILHPGAAIEPGCYGVGHGVGIVASEAVDAVPHVAVVLGVPRIGGVAVAVGIEDACVPPAAEMGRNVRDVVRSYERFQTGQRGLIHVVACFHLVAGEESVVFVFAQVDERLRCGVVACRHNAFDDEGCPCFDEGRLVSIVEVAGSQGELAGTDFTVETVGNCRLGDGLGLAGISSRCPVRRAVVNCLRVAVLHTVGDVDDLRQVARDEFGHRG